MSFVRPKTALLPCVNTVAVGAEQAQVAFIGLPILKAATPRPVPALWSNFRARINVVNLKGAHIVHAAFNATPAKLCDKRQLSTPVRRLFVRAVSVLVPVFASALLAAKALLLTGERLLASLARIAPSPAMGEVAGARTKMPRAVFQAVGVHFIRSAALATSCFNRLISHADSIIAASVYATTHLDKQPRLFEEPAPKPVQESMFGEGS